MRTTPLLTLGIIAAAIGLGGCEMIGDILQFGIGVGIVLMIVVVAIIWWLMKKFRGR